MALVLGYPQWAPSGNVWAAVNLMDRDQGMGRFASNRVRQVGTDNYPGNGSKFSDCGNGETWI